MDKLSIITCYFNVNNVLNISTTQSVIPKAHSDLKTTMKICNVMSKL